MTTYRFSEPTTEPTTEPAEPAESPAVPSADSTRSRRSILGAGIAGVAGLVLGSLGRPLAAEASAGGSLVMGAANSAGTANTSLTTASTGDALLVTQTGAGTALRGSATALNGIAGFFTSANGPGVSGVTANDSKFGVYGANDAATHGTGAAIRANGEQNHGLVASTASSSSFAIRATNSGGTGILAGGGIRVLASSGTDADIDGTTLGHGAGEFCGENGVLAVAVNGGVGVFGSSDSSNGVMGESTSGDGVYGGSDGGYGVNGYSANHIGVFGQSGTATGVYGYSASGDALYANGNAGVGANLTVTGSVSKGGGSFKIDHPLDPANKFLYHSFVESPDMKNVYDGVVTLDSAGEATVTLPDWFEALNRDFRYQLTSIGSFSPLFVKSKLQNGAFTIAGGASGQEVSWQLTGIRKDAWAEANRIPVEEAKSAEERGLYLHPTLHGQPAAKGIDAALRAAPRLAGR